MIVIRTVVEIQAPMEACFDACRDVELHERSAAQTDERAVGGKTEGMVEQGDEITWSARHLGIRWRLTSRIVEMDRPDWFADEQVRGPFKSMRHEHRFERMEGGTRVTGIFYLSAPLGPLGRLAEWLFLRRHMTRFLERRNAWLKAHLEA